MAILQFQDTQVAVGVDWSVYRSKGALRKAMRSAKGRGQNGHLVQQHDKELVLGVHACPSKTVYAGAAIVAQVHPDAVLCESVTLPGGETAWWVCAITDGIPSPAKDRLMDEGEARAEITELMSYQPNSVLLGTFGGSHATFEQVLESATEKQRQASRLERPTSIKLIGASAAAVIVAIAGAGFATKQYLDRTAMQRQKDSLAASQQNQLMAALQLKLKREADVKAAQQQFRNEVETARNQMRMHAVPQALYQAWIDVSRQLPVSFHGWAPMELRCDERQCTVRWTMTPLGRSIDGSAIPNATRVNDTEVTQTWPIKEIEVVPTRPVGASRSEEVRLTLKSLGETYRWNVQPDNANAVVVQPPPMLKDSEKPVTVGLRGRWRFATMDAVGVKSQSDYFVHSIDTHALPVKLTGMTMTGLGMQGSLNISLEGEYVVLEDSAN
ncbi:type 4b pilus protein PilO2 [Noviherbaspirillum galbum]|uniref:Type 4b pilus protein PilO2 n=1 Tax=Noviherbaspirillum galbum TaxID=2709383 RepID=A0A6B3SRH1_9BURK|nr:type 4b pilus protein PilO2 [Noviherbaspirillum galbum]NEX63367.1 type 4b pilus protein PilO2 [Noviherbaspirillum galbum]